MKWERRQSDGDEAENVEIGRRIRVNVTGQWNAQLGMEEKEIPGVVENVQSEWEKWIRQSQSDPIYIRMGCPQPTLPSFYNALLFPLGPL